VPYPTTPSVHGCAGKKANEGAADLVIMSRLFAGSDLVHLAVFIVHLHRHPRACFGMLAAFDAF